MIVVSLDVVTTACFLIPVKSHNVSERPLCERAYYSDRLLQGSEIIYSY
jgi:hypothetical protein